MSVSFHTYLYVGIKIFDYLNLDKKEKTYQKFDEKTGQKTDEVVVESTEHILKFGDRNYTETVKGKGGVQYFYDALDELFDIDYSENLSWYHDYENHEDSILGIQLTDSGDLSYGSGEAKEFSLRELSLLMEEADDLIKEKYGLHVSSKLIMKSSAG